MRNQAGLRRNNQYCDPDGHCHHIANHSRTDSTRLPEKARTGHRAGLTGEGGTFMLFLTDGRIAMKRFHKISTLAVLFLFSVPAQAVFHLWGITEVYSNADGTIQFIELVGQADNQHLLEGHTMVANSDGTENSITFPNDLHSSSTNNRRMLLATPGFNDLPGGVQPDYEIPAGFFDPEADTITLNFAENSDTFTFSCTDLPTDGTLSLLTTFSTAVNSPENFAGDTGELMLPTIFEDRFEGSGCDG